MATVMPGFPYFAAQTRGPSPNPPEPEVPAYRVEHCCDNPAHVKLWIVDNLNRLIATPDSAEAAIALVDKLNSGAITPAALN